MQKLITPRGDHSRQLVEQIQHLLPDQWHQHAEQRRQRTEKQQKHNPDCQAVRQPALQPRYQPLQQIGEHHTGQQRRQLVTETDNNGKPQRQHNRQHNRLFIGEISLNPASKNF